MLAEQLSLVFKAHPGEQFVATLSGFRKQCGILQAGAGLKGVARFLTEVLLLCYAAAARGTDVWPDPGSACH